MSEDQWSGEQRLLLFVEVFWVLNLLSMWSTTGSEPVVVT